MTEHFAGIMISNQNALSAAHKTMNIERENCGYDAWAVLGLDTINPQEIQIIDIQVPDNANVLKGWSNDIAVLTVSQKIKMLIEIFSLFSKID